MKERKERVIQQEGRFPYYYLKKKKKKKKKKAINSTEAKLYIERKERKGKGDKKGTTGQR